MSRVRREAAFRLYSLRSPSGTRARRLRLPVGLMRSLGRKIGPTEDEDCCGTDFIPATADQPEPAAIRPCAVGWQTAGHSGPHLNRRTRRTIEPEHAPPRLAQESRMPENGTPRLLLAFAASFTGLSCAVFLLLATKTVSVPVGLLMLVALVGMHLGFGILIVVWRLTDKLE